MSGITLSKAVRSNLLNLQSTADLLSRAQERLSTGLRVNSAIDNPNNFFTAQNLNSRANDLTQLLDAVSSAIQTVNAADRGITGISKLVESAQATARQALQTSATVGASGVTASTSTSNTSALTIYDVGPAAAAGTTGIAIADDSLQANTLFSEGQTITYSNGVDSVTIEFYDSTNGPYSGSNVPQNINSTFTIADMFEDETDYFNLGSDSFSGGNFSISSSSGNVVVDLGSDTTHTLTISGTAATMLGIAGTFAPHPLVTSGNETAGDVTINGQTVSLADGDTASDILGKFQSAAGSSAGTDAFTVSNASGVLTFSGTNGNDLDISGDANTLAALGLSDTTIDGTPGGAPNPKRAELVDSYNEILSQIDTLAKDSGYNGVNLLKGDTLAVLFNEDGSSKLNIVGEVDDASTLGLGTLASTAFDSNSSINDVLDDLTGAIDNLRAHAVKLGSSLSIVQTRREFTTNMVDVLQKGASNLTLADANTEAADVLALQTRQQLSSTALSLASQADQNVLRLF
ncbi:MAG TPA: flagellin [Devosia sp.]|nr:flagellin [Devosia sp.]